jgi:hypothetical protein
LREKIINANAILTKASQGRLIDSAWRWTSSALMIFSRNFIFTYFDKKLLTHQAVIPYIEIALIAVSNYSGTSTG